MTDTTARSVLLLGGAGFMGRALCARLGARGYDVHVLTRGTALEIAEGCTVHGGGIENTELLRRLLPRMGTVVHLASATTPGLSAATPSLEADLNIAPTLGLLGELIAHPRVRLVYVSSGGTVYGDPGGGSADESSELKPLSFYGAGKVAAETFLRCFQQRHGNPLVILRPSNVYGPGQPRYQGFGVIRTMLQHALDGTTMGIWGDGSIVRDFVYIDDVVSAMECFVADDALVGTFNVGAGVGHSLNDLVAIIERVSGRPLSVRHEAARGIDVQRIVLDTRAIRQRCGWTSTTSLEAGVATTWQWLRAQ
ncbi:NAD-dependent epimerase/dehydratase family protein [Dokdonella fugitiva]|nr:NAD-dependent epimerase/dehydratase family protein [Dokdonella fugitiva]